MTTAASDIPASNRDNFFRRKNDENTQDAHLGLAVLARAEGQAASEAGTTEGTKADAEAARRNGRRYRAGTGRRWRA